MAVYGYARVSTEHQNIERQIRNIQKEYPEVKRIFEEKWTGTTTDREQFLKLRKSLKSGDIVVFDSVSRMSRTAKEGVEMYKEMMNKGIDLVFLKEGHINTSIFRKARDDIHLPEVKTGEKSTDQFINSIMEAIEVFMGSLIEQQVIKAFEQAEKEVLDLRQRTKEGIETARIAGKQIGRPTGSGKTFITKKEKEILPMIKKLAKSFGGNFTDQECIKMLNISKTTFYKYKNKIKNS